MQIKRRWRSLNSRMIMCEKGNQLEAYQGLDIVSEVV